jgi:regulator of protease activity HflC (stomatin/prohibitin superfamily)
MLIAIAIAAGALGLLGLSSLRIYREYERAIVFRLGRARTRALGPGPALLIPLVDRAVVVDTRTRVIQIPAQEVISRDNITMAVDAVVYADVASPADAILRVERYLPATLQLAATTLRSVLGRMELDEILGKRAEINDEIREILDQRTEQWGVEISAVEIKDISLPQEMKRALARQAEAERERRAKIITSEGELQAAEKLTQAAALIGSQPAALQLRTLQTLVEVSAEKNHTIVFPIPIELMPGTGRAATAAGTAALDASGSLGSLASAAAMAIAGADRERALTAGASSSDTDRLGRLADADTEIADAALQPARPGPR